MCSCKQQRVWLEASHTGTIGFFGTKLGVIGIEEFTAAAAFEPPLKGFIGGLRSGSSHEGWIITLDSRRKKTRMHFPAFPGEYVLNALCYRPVYPIHRVRLSKLETFSSPGKRNS